MVSYLYHLHQIVIGRYPGDNQAVFFQNATIAIVELITMAMSLEYLIRAIAPVRSSAGE
jgi:hypothetical protein